MATHVDTTPLLVRANYRCEYCHHVLDDSLIERDHIVPAAHRGPTIASNLAVACRRCNGNKRDADEGYDPFLCRTAALFNPRSMNWADHFHRIGGEVVGKSSIGRVTAKILFRDTDSYVPPDLKWDKINVFADNELVYRHFNYLRYKRLRNRFAALQVDIRTIPRVFELTPQQQSVAKHISAILQLEMLFTRSRPEDIDRGIRVGRRYLARSSPEFEPDIKRTLSVLYEQRATIHFNCGNIKVAIRANQQAQEICPDGKNVSLCGPSQNTNTREFGHVLRAFVLGHKYQSLEVPDRWLADVVHFASDLDQARETLYLSCVPELVLLNVNTPPKTTETVFSMITRYLETCGYGTSIDQAKFINVRRRWWLLHLLVGEPVPLEAFDHDLRFWRSLHMYNELRELYAGLVKLTLRKAVSPSSELKEIVSTVMGH